MTKGTYPIIATLNYEDKHIKIQIPYRVRYFQLIKNLCPVCEKEGSLKDIEWYFDTYKPKDMCGVECQTIHFEGVGYKTLPKVIFPDEHTIYCPVCYRKNKQQIRTNIRFQDMYALYTAKTPRYLNIFSLTVGHLLGPHRWKLDERKSRNSPEGKPIYYATTLERIYSVANFFNNEDYKKNIKRGTKVSVIVNEGITEEQLKILFEKYMHRKFLRRL